MSQFFQALGRLLITSTLAISSSLVLAQDTFPSRPIRLIVPYASGGTTDQIARLIGQKLGEQWGQTVVVDFRPGGGTVIGATAAAKSPPDGYTWLLTVNTHVINEHLMAKLPYHPIKDFVPLATLATTDYLLVVNSSLPVKSPQEFIAYAKARPGEINFGTHGVGGLTHLAVNMFQAQAGIKLQLVPYKGPALPGMLANEVQVEFDALATVLPHIQSGKLKAIGVTGKQRVPAMPQVPTLQESGLPDFDVTVWYGLLAPAGVPAAVADKIRTGIAAAMARPEVKSKLATLGLQPFESTPAQFEALLKSDSAKYGEIIRAGNIKQE